MSHDPGIFSIGEFSQISGLSVKTLRFYDERGLLKPAQVDAATGYRFYDTASADRARVIARLRELQFSLEDVARILIDCGDEADLLSYLERQHRVIANRLRADRKVTSALAQMINDEKEAVRMAETGRFEVEEKQIASMLVASVRRQGRYEECGAAFSTLSRAMGRQIAGKPLCLYYDGEYRDEDANFEPCFPIRQPGAAPEGIAVRTLAPIRCLSLVHRGPYRQLGRSYKKVLADANRRGCRIELPTREVFLKGPGMIFRGDPRRYLTEIQLPIDDS
jgi:DNA-binding transcriptional MerR regulator